MTTIQLPEVEYDVDWRVRARRTGLTQTEMKTEHFLRERGAIKEWQDFVINNTSNVLGTQDQRNLMFFNQKGYTVEEFDGYLTPSRFEPKFYRTAKPEPEAMVVENAPPDPVIPSQPMEEEDWTYDYMEDEDQAVLYDQIFNPEPQPIQPEEPKKRKKKVHRRPKGWYTKGTVLLTDKKRGYIPYTITTFDNYWKRLFGATIPNEVFGVRYNHKYEPWLNNWNGKKWLW